MIDDYVGYWPMDETSGQNVADASSNHYDGTATGTIIVGGKIGNARGFVSANGDYITVGGNHFPFSKTTPFSVALWFKTSTTANEIFVSNWRLTVSPGWILRVGYPSAGVINAGLYNQDGSQGRARNTIATFNDDAWNHAVFTYDGSNTAAGILIYINGAPESLSTNKDTDPGALVDYDLKFGRAAEWSSNFLDGVLDDARIYNRGFSASEVTELYNFTGGVKLLRPNILRPRIFAPGLAR